MNNLVQCLHPTVQQALQKHGIAFTAIECDPEYADTALFCEHYNYSVGAIGQCHHHGLAHRACKVCLLYCAGHYQARRQQGCVQADAGKKGVFCQCRADHAIDRYANRRGNAFWFCQSCQFISMRQSWPVRRSLPVRQPAIQSTSGTGGVIKTARRCSC
jgi:hypothetical protein